MREEIINLLGYKVIRFSHKEILTQIGDVVKK